MTQVPGTKSSQKTTTGRAQRDPAPGGEGCVQSAAEPRDVTRIIYGHSAERVKGGEGKRKRGTRNWERGTGANKRERPAEVPASPQVAATITFNGTSRMLIDRPAS